MKQEQLLEAIGGIDEGFLMESEKAPSSKIRLIRRSLLVAAAIGTLVLTVAAATGLFSRPIENSDIISGETVAPFTMDAEGNIDPSGAAGLKVTMQVQINENAPAYLEEFYVLEMSDQWCIAGGSCSGDGYHYYTQGYEWKKGTLPGRIRLEQSVTAYYTQGIYGENCVGTLPKLTAEDGVTAQITEIAGISVLKVTIPALPRYANDPSIDSHYCVDGETRLYWTDGNYMLMFAYPAWMADSEAEQLILSLEKQPYVDATPDDYGKVNPESIANRLPDFSIGTETGTTCANNTMGLGRFAYSDGYIYCAGAENHIYCYDLQSGQVKDIILSDRFAGPGEMFVTDNYICYVDSWSDLMVVSKDGVTEEAVYQGIHSARLYAEGSTLYTASGIIDLTTGRITNWPEGVYNYYVDANYIYALKEGENCFLRAPKGTMDFVSIPVSFCPISIFADGEDIYMTQGGTTNWTVIRYHNGQETKLPIRALEFQVFDGTIIYRCEQSQGQAIKSYDLQTGEIRVLHEDGFNFSILNNRYVCICCADDEGQSYSVILDWQTGETVTIDTAK